MRAPSGLHAELKTDRPWTASRWGPGKLFPLGRDIIHSVDTAEFAVQSIHIWLERMGRAR